MLRKIREKFMPLLIAAVLIGGVYSLFAKNTTGSNGSSSIVNVEVPNLSPLAQQGESLFNETCVACHGKNAGGSENGPPLVHQTYNPGHHGDEAFVIAAKNGVRAHHWRFGNMPAVENVGRRKALTIVRYIRELQQANGIVTRPHNM